MNLQVFENSRFGEVRTIQVEGEPWFVAADVCRALEILNTTDAIKRLDEDEKSRFNLGLPGGATNCVNEFGLYTLILASRKKEAKQFKRWITHEVIPAIRKDGGYMTARLNETPEQIMARALKIADRTLEKQRERLNRLQAENEVLEPLAAFAKSVSSSEDTILVRELAKQLSQNGIPIGGNRLFDWMRNNGYLINSRTSDRNSPTQKAMELGLFEVSTTTISTADGRTKIRHTPKVTGKGQQYFFEKFRDLMEREENSSC